MPRSGVWQVFYCTCAVELHTEQDQRPDKHLPGPDADAQQLHLLSPCGKNVH